MITSPPAKGKTGSPDRTSHRATMQCCWQIAADHLICTWSEVDVRVPYNLHWMQDTSQLVSPDQGISAPPDFRRFSLLSGSRWLKRERDECQCRAAVIAQRTLPTAPAARGYGIGSGIAAASAYNAI
jgi:hypothetical protein